MESPTLKATTVLSVIAVSLVFSSVAFAALTTTQKLPSKGVVKAIGVYVYWDSACTQNVTQIDWGSLAPGTSKNVTVYVRNEGTTPVTLTMATGSWVPTGASTYLKVVWDRQNYRLAQGSSARAIFTLTVLSTTTGITTFSFDITITGTESA